MSFSLPVIECHQTISVDACAAVVAHANASADTIRAKRFGRCIMIPPVERLGTWPANFGLRFYCKTLERGSGFVATLRRAHSAGNNATMPSSRIPARRAIANVLLALACALALPAIGQTFPSKPAKLVVPFPPGGPLDTTGRTIARKLGEAWGQSVIVENKAGAGGNI